MCKRAHLHSECENDTAVPTQQRVQRDKRGMPLPPDLLGTTEKIDDTLRRQHRLEADMLTEETRSLLQTI
jgi:hypothetical protein